MSSERDKAEPTYSALLIERLRSRRAKRNLSYIDVVNRLVARGVDVDVATYRSWEKGEAIPIDVLPALSASLGFPNVKSMLPSSAACEHLGLIVQRDRNV